MKKNKDKTDAGRASATAPKSTKARTAGGRKLNPEVMASAEQKALGMQHGQVILDGPKLQTMTALTNIQQQ